MNRIERFFDELSLDEIDPDSMNILNIEKGCLDIIARINEIKAENPTLDHDGLFQYVLKVKDAVKEPYNFRSLPTSEVSDQCWIVYPHDRAKRHFVRIGDKTMQSIELMKMYYHHQVKLTGEAVSHMETCPLSCVNPDHAIFKSMLEIRRENMSKAREALK